MRRALFTLALACATGCLWDWSTPDAATQPQTQNCAAGGCTFQCSAGQTCNTWCPGGGCKLTCDQGSTCSSSCDGGGCTVNCAAGASCTSSCVGGNCVCNGTCK